jgi:hypothetical protein
VTTLQGPTHRQPIATIGSARSPGPQQSADPPAPPPAVLCVQALGGLCWIALGGLVVALAYTAGREHRWGASGLYWIGQALIFLPAAYRILGGRGDWRSHLITLVGIAGIQGALMWAYSPDVFRFGDELQHLRTAEDILRTHHLFHSNPTLAVSPGFPGLEEITTAISTMSGLSLNASGRIVAALSHMLVPVFLYATFRVCTRSNRTAAIAALMYTADPHYSYFDVLWAYGTPALAFLALMFRNSMLSLREGSSPVLVGLAYIPIMITHHLTALVALVLLGVFIIAAAIDGQRVLAAQLTVLMVVLLAITGAYIAVAAPGTLGYLAAPFSSLLAALSIGHAYGPTSQSAPPHVSPRWESMVAILGAGVTLAGSMIGIAVAWWANARRGVQLVVTCAASYLVVLIIRVTAADGSELASRALTYAMFVIALALAVAIEPICRPLGRRFGLLLPLAIFGFLIVAMVVSAEPPAWERIPGRVTVAADESGVDARMVVLNQWLDTRDWGRTVYVACDWDVCPEVGALTDANPETDAALMYDARELPNLDKQVSVITADYVETDQRWTFEVPQTGTYFAGDVDQHSHALPRWVVTRFNRDPLMDQVYDDGDIRFYNTYWVWHS